MGAIAIFWPDYPLFFYFRDLSTVAKPKNLGFGARGSREEERAGAAAIE